MDKKVIQFSLILTLAFLFLNIQYFARKKGEKIPYRVQALTTATIGISLTRFLVIFPKSVKSKAMLAVLGSIITSLRVKYLINKARNA